jgi:1-acyl-sn-glycerol-3-phosphate acyltransferase
MTLTKLVITKTIRCITDILCRTHDDELSKVPQQGPLIIVANHINFLEIPVLYTHLYPRPMTGYAAAKSWKNPLFAFLFDQWGAISIRRGEPDLAAIRQGLDWVNQGNILAIAPEGTRSGTGILNRGHPGVVTLALKCNVPILPIAYYGSELFWQNIKRLRRTNFYIVVGDPFYVHSNGEKVKNNVRQRAADEIMYQLAALLPPKYRGYYADLEEATEDYLSFPPPSRSNLSFASEQVQNPREIAVLPIP